MLFILLFNDAFVLPIISIFEIWSLMPSGFHLNQPQEACWCTIYLRLAVHQLAAYTTGSCCTLHPPHVGYFHLSWLLTPLWVAAPFNLHTLVIFTSVGYLHHWELLHPSTSTPWLFSPQLATYTTVSCCTLQPPHLGYFHLSWLLTPLWVAAPFNLHTLVIFTSVGYLHHCELLHPSTSTPWLFSPQLATHTTGSCCTLQPPHLGYFHLSWLPTPLGVAAPFNLHTLVIFTSVGYVHHCELLHPSTSTPWLFSPQLATHTTGSCCTLQPPHLGYFHLSWLLTPLGVAAPFNLHTLVIFTSVGYLHHCELLHPSTPTPWLFSPQLATYTTVSCCTLQPPHLGYFHLSWLRTPLGVAAPFNLHTLVIFTSVGYSHHWELLHPSTSTPWLFSPQLATHTTGSCCTLQPPHLGYFHLSWLLTPLGVAAPFNLHTLVIFTSVGYLHHWELLHPSTSTPWLFSPQLATHTTGSCCTLQPPHLGYFHLSWLRTPLGVAAPFNLHTLVIFTSVGYLHHCELLHPSTSTRWLFSPQLATHTTGSCCTLQPPQLGYFHLSWLLTPLGVAAPFNLHTLVIFTSVGYVHHSELLHPSTSTFWLFSPQLATYTTGSCCTLQPPHLGYFHLSWLLTSLWVTPFTLHTLVIFTSVGYSHHWELLHPSTSTPWLFSPQLATYTTVSCTLHPPHLGYFHLSWLPTPLWVAPFTLHTLVIFTSVGYSHHCELHPSPSTRWLFSPQLATHTTVSCFTLHTLVIFTSVGYLHHCELPHPSPSTHWLFSPQLATYTTVSCTPHPPHIGYFPLSWLPTPLWAAPSPSTRWLFSPQLATYTTVSCTLTLDALVVSGRCRRSTSGCARRTTRTRTAWRGRMTGTAARVATTRWSLRPGCCGSTRAGSRPGWRSSRTTTGSSRHSCSGFGSC